MPSVRRERNPVFPEARLGPDRARDRRFLRGARVATPSLPRKEPSRRGVQPSPRRALVRDLRRLAARSFTAVHRANERNQLLTASSSSSPDQQPPKAPESKAAKAAKAMAGGKGKKKKWSKGKNKEKANNQVLFEQSTYDKLMSEVPKYKMITVSILTDRLRITCSLARKAIAILIAQKVIKPVTMHSKQQIYTKTAVDEAEA